MAASHQQITVIDIIKEHTLLRFKNGMKVLIKYMFVKWSMQDKFPMLTSKSIRIKFIHTLHKFTDGKITNKSQKILNTKFKKKLTSWRKFMQSERFTEDFKSMMVFNLWTY